MAETMIPSKQNALTDRQINKAVGLYRAMLEKHAPELDSGPTQLVLGDPGLAAEQLAVFRRRVEAQSKMIMRHVKVNRGREPQQVLDATGRAQYTDRQVVSSIPRGEGEEVDIYFFDLNYDPTTVELQKEYELRGFKADPIAQAQVNIDDPSFADERPNGCQWDVEPDGIASFVTFERWSDGRDVRVDRNGSGWGRYCRFGGVRK